MTHAAIEIVNARTHNLKNLSLAIPKRRLVAFTGVSGSGKSSLLFDTVFTEAQRQLVETFSTFARTRLPKSSRPDVDEIRNLSTAILIDQKPMGSNLRSTLGTATELVAYLRLLFSRLADPFIGPSFYYSFNHPEGMCPDCRGLGKRIRVDPGKLLKPELSLREGAVDHPDLRPGTFFWRELMAIGLFDVDKPVADFSAAELDRLLYAEPTPVTKPHGVNLYLKNWEGLARRWERLKAAKADDEADDAAKTVYDAIYVYSDCPSCAGSRLNARALGSRLNGLNIGELCRMELRDLLPWLEAVEGPAAATVLRKAKLLLAGLIEIGVGYLTLERPTSTLSGGENQRVKTARQLDCDLTDLLYVLDEPSAGLHPRDTASLISLLGRLRDGGNSVLVVEHDPEIIRAAEWVVDIGPGGGEKGGTVVYNGPAAGLAASGGATALSLAGEARTAPSRAAEAATAFLEVRGATANNLKGVDARFPVGRFSCVTGVAGSGKSSLVRDCFLAAHPEAVVIDQSPIGRTSRGNLATYTGVFDLVRKIFAASSGRDASLFSFNSAGACPKCGGQGVLTTELFFLDAVRTVCDECAGKRFRPEVLQLRHGGKSIDEVLEMTAGEARAFFGHQKIRAQMDLLVEVGLDYLKIGQTLSSLSGGEAQRLKIAAELSKTGAVYVLDEPTTGLHLSDMAKLRAVVARLTAAGNTVIVVEHNPDLIKYADWIVDLGPEGGRDGGRLLYQGPPAGLLACPESRTAPYLAERWTAE
jgi:excinuclease UvrABC ATPase subunit